MTPYQPLARRSRGIARLVAATMLMASLVTACGGGGESTVPSPPNNPPPPPSGIGTTGGTVNGPSGAKVVVPAGALASNVDITIAESSVGAPALPAGFTTIGSMFAFTPHGTTFAVPATVTVPFDTTKLPAGTTPLLYKTNATQSAWDPVPRATASGGAMTGSVSGFSFIVVVLPPAAPTVDLAFREWFYTLYSTGTEDNYASEEADTPTQQSVNRDVYDQYDRGPLLLHPATEPENALATMYSTASGDTYWVTATAPRGDITKKGQPTGVGIDLTQTQVFRKTDNSATFKIVISRAALEGWDSNAEAPQGPQCPYSRIYDPSCLETMMTSLDVYIQAWTERYVDREIDPYFQKVLLVELYFGATLKGWIQHWHFQAGNDVFSYFPVWDEASFDLDVDLDGTNLQTHAMANLKNDITIEIPIDSVELDAEFTVQTNVAADAINRRQGESYLSSRFRDPQKVNGIKYLAQGVVLVASRTADIPTPPPPAEPLPAPACATGTDSAAGILQFDVAESVAGERPNGKGRITVTRSGGSHGLVTARLSTHDGTARQGIDYQAVSGLARFVDGEQGTRIVTIPILDDHLVNGVRTVDLTLTEPMGCVAIGPQATTTLRILDDEGQSTDAPPPATYTVGGTVSGLSGAGLVLRDFVLAENVAVNANGAFALPSMRANGTAYDVRVSSQPDNPIQLCAIAQGSGTITGAPVNSITVSCSTPPPTGSLDPGFGGGKVSNSFSPAKAVALQADGKSVVVGAKTLSRYNTDGSLDATFGTAGKVTVVMNGGFVDAVEAIAIQSDGKIVIAGHTSTPPSQVQDFAVQRFNSDGSLDASFGIGGKVLTDFAGNEDAANALVLQPDGKIVAAGVTVTSVGSVADGDFAVVRYLADGSLDAGFGTGGKASTTVGGKADFGYGVALQTDGKLVIAGRVGIDGGSDPDFGLVRFTATGAVDTTFGTGGKAQIAFAPNTWDEAEDVAIQADGKIVAGGFTRVGASYQYAVLRLNTDGMPDAGFGNAGKVNTGLATRDNFGRALAIQGDGKIVLAGQVSTLANADFGVARFLADGTTDITFGTAGVLTIDFFGATDNARDVLVQPDGKILVIGSAANGTAGLAMARITP
ncbi:MAG: Calx-beta domain-containing protein [Pseudomonadota bacterium]